MAKRSEANRKRSGADGKRSEALTRLLEGLDDPCSQDPAGFGREDVDVLLREAAGTHIKYGSLHQFLHSPDYSRDGLAKRLRTLKGLT